MPKVVVVGGGFAGVSAAACARNAGSEVTLVERTDELLGLGRYSGMFYNDGRMSAVEELIALGGGFIFDILMKPPVMTYERNEMNWTALEDLAHREALDISIFNCMLAEPAIRKYLSGLGVNLIFEDRAVDAAASSKDGKERKLTSVTLESGKRLEADSFVDCSGGAGGIQVCIDHGYGCVECNLRCNSFGDRVSIATKAGAKELRKLRTADRGGGFGAISSACSFYETSIDPTLVARLKKNGTAKIEVPEEVREMLKVGLATNWPYDPSQVKFLKLSYPGFFKANGMVYMPLKDVRRIPGFEKARFSDPLGGGKGNAVRYISMAPRENTMKVFGFGNLFVGGEKSGPVVGIQECIVTGGIAGYNAAREAQGRELLTPPRTTVIGEFFAYVQKMMETDQGLMQTYSFMKPSFRKIMASKGWWAKTVPEAIEESRRRIAEAKLTGVMSTSMPVPITK
ncbi:MAG TPA: FAD-dependent oxidoreductase [Nitrososphaerales archaeon]|nr:FAD-dependent oxidoreductase [Nitrososphaerales archaeon]